MELSLPKVLREVVDPVVDRLATAAVDGWEWTLHRAAISPRRAAQRQFKAFGPRSSIERPWRVLMGEPWIEIGTDCLISPGAILAAAAWPDGCDHTMITIGDRCWAARGLGIVAHDSVTIGDDVWFGPDVYVTDVNHAYEDITKPVGLQMEAPKPVVIGSGSWIGTGAVVLPGVTIGEHCAIGANAVVHRDIPPFSVAVGSPAKVIRRYEPGDGWIATTEPGPLPLL